MSTFRGPGPRSSLPSSSTTLPPTARKSPPNAYPTPPPKLTTYSKVRYTTSQDLTLDNLRVFFLPGFRHCLRIYGLSFADPIVQCDWVDIQYPADLSACTGLRGTIFGHSLVLQAQRALTGLLIVPRNSHGPSISYVSPCPSQTQYPR